MSILHLIVQACLSSLTCLCLSACVSCSCCCAAPSAMAMLQLSLPTVRVLLVQQCTTHVKLTWVNATERVMLVRSPADQHAFHDELPGAC